MLDTYPMQRYDVKWCAALLDNKPHGVAAGSVLDSESLEKQNFKPTDPSLVVFARSCTDLESWVPDTPECR